MTEESDHQSYSGNLPIQDIPSDLRFSNIVTTICVLVCITGIGLVVWSVSLSDNIRFSSNTHRDLDRLASRMLGFEARLPELSSVEQILFHLGGQAGDTREQIRLWYEEADSHQTNPLQALYLGILKAETESPDVLANSMSEWDTEGFPVSVFRTGLEVAYLQKDISDAEYESLQAYLAEEVPVTWFYFHLAQRIALQVGDAEFHNTLQAQFHQFTDVALRKWQGLLICELGIIMIGVFFLIRQALGHFGQSLSHEEEKVNPSRTPWSCKEGIAVLARGGAFAILVIGMVALIPNGPELIETYGVMLMYVPPVLIGYLLLLRPKGLSLWDLFVRSRGSRNIRNIMKLIPVLFSVMALGLLGDLVIMLVGDSLHTSVHWTEWFVPQLVWGSQTELLKTCVEFVLLAPVCEELIFRGMLFATLRAKFNFAFSMIGSTLIFALAHGYGLIAFLTVLWSGALWAWAYEKTGSLIPGIIAHAMNNGLVVYTLVAFFR